MLERGPGTSLNGVRGSHFMAEAGVVNQWLRSMGFVYVVLFIVYMTIKKYITGVCMIIYGLLINSRAYTIGLLA